MSLLKTDRDSIGSILRFMTINEICNLMSTSNYLYLTIYKLPVNYLTFNNIDKWLDNANKSRKVPLQNVIHLSNHYNFHSMIGNMLIGGMSCIECKFASPDIIATNAACSFRDMDSCDTVCYMKNRCDLCTTKSTNLIDVQIACQYYNLCLTDCNYKCYKCNKIVSTEEDVKQFNSVLSISRHTDRSLRERKHIICGTCSKTYHGKLYSTNRILRDHVFSYS